MSLTTLIVIIIIQRHPHLPFIELIDIPGPFNHAPLIIFCRASKYSPNCSLNFNDFLTTSRLLMTACVL